MARGPLLVCLALLAAGCAPGIPGAGLARQQVPAAAASTAPFQGSGRCRLETPLTRLSCRALVRRDGDGLRLVLLADEGPVLLDLDLLEGRVFGAHPDLRPQAGTFARLGRAAWGPPPEGAATWEDDRLRMAGGGMIWRYGGDPLLLRRVEGGGADVDIGDYRPGPGGLVAHQVRLALPGFALALELGAVHPAPAQRQAPP